MSSDSEILFEKQNPVIPAPSNVLLKANSICKTKWLKWKNIIQIMIIALCTKELNNLANIRIKIQMHSLTIIKNFHSALAVLFRKGCNKP